MVEQIMYCWDIQFGEIHIILWWKKKMACLVSSTFELWQSEALAISQQLTEARAESSREKLVINVKDIHYQTWQKWYDQVDMVKYLMQTENHIGIQKIMIK